jgi:hypothetical protein
VTSPCLHVVALGVTPAFALGKDLSWLRLPLKIIIAVYAFFVRLSFLEISTSRDLSTCGRYIKSDRNLGKSGFLPHSIVK